MRREDRGHAVGEGFDAVEGEQRMPHELPGHVLGELPDAVQGEPAGPVGGEDRGHRGRHRGHTAEKEARKPLDPAEAGLGREHECPRLVEPREAGDFERPLMLHHRVQPRQRNVVGHANEQRAHVMAEALGHHVIHRNAAEMQLADVRRQMPGLSRRKPFQVREAQMPRAAAERLGRRGREPLHAMQVQLAAVPREVHGHAGRQLREAVERQVAPVLGKGRGSEGREPAHAGEIQLVGVPGQPEGDLGVEPGQPGEREFAPVPAERPGGGGRQRAEPVERQAAGVVAAELRRDGVGDRREPVEIEVPTVPHELAGHRERQPAEPVQVEVGLVVADDVGRAIRLGMIERQPAPRRSRDRVVLVPGDSPLVRHHRPREAGHELPRPGGVEMPDRAGLVPQGLILGR